MSPFFAFTPILSLSANVFLHIVVCRLMKKQHAVPIVIAFMIGFLTQMAFIFFDNQANHWAHNIMLVANYFFLSFGYFAFLNLGETSIRLRILREVQSRAKGITLSELKQLYNEREILQMRLERLISSKQLIEKNGRLFVERKSFFLFAAHTIVRLRILILGKSEVEYKNLASEDQS